MKIQEGNSYSYEGIVREDMLASSMVKGTPPVLGTPALVCFIEEATYAVMAEDYEEGETSVGVDINITHSAPTPLGMKIRCESKVTKIKGKIIAFEVEVFDEKESISKGIHTRAFVNQAKIAEKAASKVQS